MTRREQMSHEAVARAQASVDRTSDGVEIKIGMRVITNELVWGTVTHAPETYNPGWWGVTYDGEEGQCFPRIFNGERMAIRDNICFTKDPKGA